MRADDQDKSAAAPPQVRKLAEKMFLGPEMLTWLYFTLIEEGMEMELPTAFPKDTPDEDTMVHFAIGKRAQLRTIDATGAKVALTGPGLEDNGEILQAIRRGALVEVLALEVSIQSRVYGFTLRGDDGGLAGVKLPDLFSEPEDAEAAVVDPLAPGKKKRRPKLPLEDVLALRMQCLTELERVLNALFEKFLVRRLARAWRTEDVAAIRKQVASGLKNRLVDV
ncbi:MAG TPA: hypothetical protein VGO62_19540 [Myxococcota bacterium]